MDIIHSCISTSSNNKELFNSDNCVSDLMPTHEPKQTSRETQAASTIISTSAVTEALRNDCGPRAILVSWSAQECAKKGDNFSSLVTSVKVTFLLNAKLCQTSYIVKINPCAADKSFNEYIQLVFDRESKFYSLLLPKLNHELENIGQKKLKIPAFYHACLEKEHEMIFLEDLRQLGFQMHDRTKGLSIGQVTLVLEELSRLHASSILLQNRTPQKSLKTIFPFLGGMFENNPDLRKKCLKIFRGFLECGAAVVESKGGYVDVAKCLRHLSHDITKVCKELYDVKPPFQVICHGDCWNNNFLFRYDSSGTPTDVRLLDFQGCKYISPAADINFLFYTSLDGTTRVKNFQKFLDIYYNSLSKAFTGSEVSIQFTKDALLQEYHHKNIYGALAAILMLPFIASPHKDILEDASDSVACSELSWEDQWLEEQKRILNNSDLSPPLYQRILDVVHDLIKSGAFNSVNK